MQQQVEHLARMLLLLLKMMMMKMIWYEANSDIQGLPVLCPVA